MEPEFMPFPQIAPLPYFNVYPQLEIDLGDHDRPLSKDDLLDLLAIDEVEFELMLANEVLRPSLSMEYHQGRFLGFFTYWDCLATRISRTLLTHVQNVEEAIEMTEDVIPHVGEALRRVRYPFPVEASAMLVPLSALLDVIAAPGTKGRLVGHQGEIVHQLAAAVADLEETFRIITRGEHPAEVMPFAVYVSSHEPN